MCSVSAFARTMEPVWSVTSTPSGENSNSLSNKPLVSTRRTWSGVSPLTLPLLSLAEMHLVVGLSSVLHRHLSTVNGREAGWIIAHYAHASSARQHECEQAREVHG